MKVPSCGNIPVVTCAMPLLPVMEVVTVTAHCPCSTSLYLPHAHVALAPRCFFPSQTSVYFVQK